MTTKNKSNADRLYKQLVERFVNWTQTRSDIRAAFIVGSRARVDHPADEWADLDIVLITTDPNRYLLTADWIENIGNPLLTFLEPTASGRGMERRVLFEDILDVDFSIIPKREIQKLMQDGSPAEIPDVIRRGMRVLLDKDGIVFQLQGRIPSTELPLPSPPAEHEFLEVINDFWYHVVWTAKKLRRGELWTAKFCLASDDGMACSCHRWLDV
jgi:aminoglycoside 6-adenylyltransferase